MRITFDPAKRGKTLTERGLDFAETAELFAGRTVVIRDERFAYPEDRFITAGYLDDRMVVVVWTPDGDDGRRIISMRHCHADEEADWVARMG